jgi:hypothetical protein
MHSRFHKRSQEQIMKHNRKKMSDGIKEPKNNDEPHDPNVVDPSVAYLSMELTLVYTEEEGWHLAPKQQSTKNSFLGMFTFYVYLCMLVNQFIYFFSFLFSFIF